MNKEIKAIAIIPAKGDSVRLKRKNLRIIDNKTLVEHSIDYALKSKLVNRIIVTTEDTEISELVESKYGNKVIILKRPEYLLKDAEVADVYEWVIKQQSIYLDQFNYVVGVQPDHPDRTLDLDEMLIYARDNKYMDLFTVDAYGVRNGSIRIIELSYVNKGMFSRRVGSMLDICTNIHSEEDLLKAECNIQFRNTLDM